MYQVNPTYRRRLLFQSTSDLSTTGFTISVNSLIQSLGLFAATTTTVYPIANTAKINRIRIWGNTAAAGTAISKVSIVWNSATDGSQQEVGDVSTSPDMPAYVSCAPPKGTKAAWWNQVQTATLATVFVPANCLIEVDVSYQILASTNAQSAITVSGHTVGDMTFGPLDGISNNHVPALILPTP